MAVISSSVAALAVYQSMYTITTSSNTDDGEYLTNESGIALYYFANDTPGESTCFSSPYNEGGVLLEVVPNTSTCATVWPAFYTSEIMVPPELNASDFANIERDSSHKQTAIRGWPLYLYLGDKAPGDTNGNRAGKGQWVLARPFGTIRVADNPTLGAYLTDARGMTLYYYQNDRGKLKNTCTDDCATKWPAFFAGPIDIASNELNRKDFSQFMKDDNYQQTTFKGWPLYYYSGDKKPGDVNGQGIAGTWSIAALDIEANF